MSRRFLILGTVLVLLVTGLGVFAVRWLTHPARQLVQVFEGPASYSLRYPEDWLAMIPEMGIMIVAEPDTLGGQPGASMTIQRSTTLMFQGNLINTLEYYLTRGPEVYNRQWVRITEPGLFTLADGREAATLDLHGREFEQDPESVVRLVVTRADNRVIYVFGLSAPPDRWEQDEPLLMAMLDSVRFAE